LFFCYSRFAQILGRWIERFGLVGVVQQTRYATSNVSLASGWSIGFTHFAIASMAHSSDLRSIWRWPVRRIGLAGTSFEISRLFWCHFRIMFCHFSDSSFFELIDSEIRRYLFVKIVHRMFIAKIKSSFLFSLFFVVLFANIFNNSTDNHMITCYREWRKTAMQDKH
jgi:hypothetical protein